MHGGSDRRVERETGHFWEKRRSLHGSRHTGVGHRARARLPGRGRGGARGRAAAAAAVGRRLPRAVRAGADAPGDGCVLPPAASASAGSGTDSNHMRYAGLVQRPSCAHEFLEFFEDCADRVASAQPHCECPNNFGTLTVLFQLEVLNRRFRNMIGETDPTAAWTPQSRPSTPSASGSSAGSRSSTQPSSLPMTARRRAMTPWPTAKLASMGAPSAARQCTIPPAVSDIRPLYSCVRARVEP